MVEKYTSSYAYRVRDKWRIGVKYRDGETGLWKDRTRKSNARRKTDARREAERWRKELNEEARQLESDDAGLTVSKYVRSYVDNKVASGVVSDKTAYNYEQAIKVINDPAGGIDNAPIRELTPVQVREWLSWLMNDRGLRPSSAKNYYSLLKMAFRQAEADRMIDWNPLVSVKPPKLPKRVPNSLDNASMIILDRWLKTSDPTPIRTLIALAYYGGMRRGECCALMWANTDLDRGMILVSQSVSSSNPEDVKSSKTDKRRVVPIAPALHTMLSERYETMLDAISTLYRDETHWELQRRLESCYVCGGVDGSITDPHTSGIKFSGIADTLGLTGIHSPHVTLHTLRHTFATRMIGEGVDVKTVSSILGHASAHMTLDVYAAADPEAVAAAGPRIDKALSVAGNVDDDDPAYILPN